MTHPNELTSMMPSASVAASGSAEESPTESTAGVLRFLRPGDSDWRDLQLQIPEGTDDAEEERLRSRFGEMKTVLKETLLMALQMPHLVVLAGSGTSLGVPCGPSMWDLWDHCVLENPGTERKVFEPTEEAQVAIEKIGYDENSEQQDIEALLSRCDAFLSLNDDADVRQFVESCKATILENCSSFLFDADRGEWKDEKLNGHGIFLHRLSRRRVRDPRLKVFTTNYDLCFERAAALKGLVVIDGFSFAQPRLFNPSHFEYDIVRRSPLGSEMGDPLEGVFHLLKLHGSVDWGREESGQISQTQRRPNSKRACLIYPAKGKYQQSYLQPHLELMSQYLAALRKPNTCLIATGFGFNDDHLSEPILAAISSNPQLRVVIVDYRAEDHLASRVEGSSIHWQRLAQLSQQGENVWFINASFSDFANLMPDLKALTSAQQLEMAIKRTGRRDPRS